MPWVEMLIGALTLIVMLVSAWCKSQEGRLGDLEAFETKVYEHWEKDASTYVSKSDFASFAEDIKDALVRIEDKIEKLRSD